MAELPSDNHKFSEELVWCIHQLELGLERQNPDSRQAAETIKVLKILKSNKAPLVKKRQAMRNALGDYRKKMKDAEKKSISSMRHAQFVVPSAKQKSHTGSRFLRHSYKQQSSHSLDRNMTSLHIDDSQPGPSSTLSGPLPKDNPNDNGEMTGVSNSPLFSFHKFQFVPSNNSFCFDFGISGIVDKEIEDTNPEEKYNAPLEESLLTSTASVSKNFYQLEKTDNNFSFNFDVK